MRGVRSGPKPDRDSVDRPGAVEAISLARGSGDPRERLAHGGQIRSASHHDHHRNLECLVQRVEVDDVQSAERDAV